MTTPQWDRTLLTPARVSIPKLVQNNTSGGMSFSGSEQIVGNTPPLWSIRFSDIALNTPEKIRKWNEIAGILQGRLNTILIPIFDRGRAPKPPVTATVSGTVLSGSIAMSISVAAGGGALLPGMHFQAYQERLYRIVTSDGGVPSGGAVLYGVTVTPPLRNGLNDGWSLVFDDPWFRVRLASDDEMDVDLDALRFGSATVNFREDA